MAASSLELRIERASDRPPLATMAAAQWGELRAFLAEAESLEDLPGKWQAAIVAAEQATGGDAPAGGCSCCGGP